MRLSRFVRLLLVLCVLLVTATAGAQTPSLEGALIPRELDALGAWVASHDHPKCTERCFVLDRLSLGGSLETGVTFSLEGSVLADGAVAIPLFGPPSQVRLEKVTEDGKPAAIGFESDHYFAYTASKHFVIKGTLGFTEEHALAIIGPLNTLESNLTKGAVVEGAKLSGLASTTIHFSTGEVEGPTDAAPEPPVFQLSRAIRVQRETTFEWRLVMRAGTDLGVVRLPLANGEKVLDVSGITGWKVEGTDLVLPTAGRSASVVVAGTLEGLGTIAGSQPGVIAKNFTIDPRSTYEWWLVEADPEHRITISGEAKQLDGADSPFPRTPASRLFLVGKGQSLGLSVETLASIEALAAVIHRYDRTLVVTDRGELVSDESITYENNGIDYLRFSPAGRPIFLSSDGVSQRILHDMAGGDSLLIALRKGMHYAHVQTLSQTTLGFLGGRLELSSSTYPLTASRAEVTIGLPESVHPIALLGGNRPQWFVEIDDGLAIAAALLLSILAFKTWTQRALGFVTLAVLWPFSHAAFFVVVAAVLAVPLARLATRLFARTTTSRARWAIAGGVSLLLVVVAVTSMERKSVRTAALSEQVDLPHAAQPSGSASLATDGKDMLAKEPQSAPDVAGKKLSGLAMDESTNTASNGKGGEDGDKQGNLHYADSTTAYRDLVAQATLDGITPVALPLPRFFRTITAKRELVTDARPFKPVVLYVTDATFTAVGIVGLLAFALLVFLHRAALIALRDRVRAFLAERPVVVTPAAPMPEAPPAE